MDIIINYYKYQQFYKITKNLTNNTCKNLLSDNFVNSFVIIIKISIFSLTNKE